MDDEMWNSSDELIDNLKASTSKENVSARLDHREFVESERILGNFFELEKHCRVCENYFDNVQSGITGRMRSILLEWMFDVCEEEQCSCEIFPLAVSLVDRFLSVESIHKQQLQVLGTVCLFIASKLKMVAPFAASRLVDYTDNAVRLSELLSWEMLVLNRLNWDVSILTPFDFLDQILYRLKLPQELINRLRPYLNYLVSVAIIDFHTATLPPSTIAASCFQVAAIHRLDDLDLAKRVVEALKEYSSTNMVNVDAYANRIFNLYIQRQENPEKSFAAYLLSHSNVFGQPMGEIKVNHDSSDSMPGTSASTPTDIEDVVLF